MPVPTVVLPSSESAIRRAAEHICAGDLVAFPTETVYGLGADATNARAVARIFEAKGRPYFNPLIVHVSDIEAAGRLGNFSSRAQSIARAFWPGPLTIVVPRAADCPVAELASAGLPTIAIRVPDNPVAQELLRVAGRPLAAPSANRSGHVSATRAEHVAADLADRVAIIIDGGATASGLESTIVDATGDAIIQLRPGAIPAEVIEAQIGERLLRAAGKAERPHSPGQLESHYATRASIRLNAIEARAGEAYLAFGSVGAGSSIAAINLSPSGDLIEAAANLFSALRELDKTGATTIAVAPIPEAGLGEAINDRLRRAAAPRP